MIEKRRHKRIKVNLNLEITSLFKQDNIKVEHIDAPIEVINISKSGIAFQSKCNLPVDYYFNACIQLGSEEAKLYCVVKIIRKETKESELYDYGCEFVGLAPVLSYIFDEYEKSITELHTQTQEK